MSSTVVEFPVHDARSHLAELRARARARLDEKEPLKEDLEALCRELGVFLNSPVWTPEAEAAFTPVYNAWSQLHQRLCAFLKDDAYQAVEPLNDYRDRLARGE